jgi:hypothetical protein
MFVACWHQCIVLVPWWPVYCVYAELTSVYCVCAVVVTSVYCVCALLTSVHCVYGELTSVYCVCAVLTSACRYARELWSMFSLSLEWIFTQLTFPYTKTTFGIRSVVSTLITLMASLNLSLISDTALVILRTAELWTNSTIYLRLEMSGGPPCEWLRTSSRGLNEIFPLQIASN